MTHRQALEYATYTLGCSIADMHRFVPMMTFEDAAELRQMARELHEIAAQVERSAKAA